METTNNKQMMVPMSSFVKAGGMETLLQYATSVTVTPVSQDPKNAENYFVDIRFRFNHKAGCPYFGETESGVDGAVTPRRLVSKLSDDPTSTEVTVLSGGNISESRGSPRDEAVYMPDACWIARTGALSSILKQEAKEHAEEKAEEDGRSVNTVTTVTSVRGVFRAVGADEDGAEPDIDKEFCFDSPAVPAAIVTDMSENEGTSALGVSDRAASMEHILGAVHDQGAVHSSDRVIKKEREGKVGTEEAAAVNASNASKAGSGGETPAGCGLLRSSSVKAAVKTMRRSFSRERLGRTSERSGNIEPRQASVSGAGEVEKQPKKRKDNFDDPELLLIQPNPVQPSRKPKSSADSPSLALNQPTPDRPTHSSPTNYRDAEVQPPQGPHLQRVTPQEARTTASVGGGDDRPDREVERDETVARGLFRRTSNLARNIIRKLSSSDKRAARHASGEGNEDPNGHDRFAKRRSWFGRQGSADDTGRRPGIVVPEASVESNQEPYRVHRRRSLIFGRRYKN